MTLTTELRYIGESGTHYIFELVVDHVLMGYCSMRKAHYRDFPDIIPKPRERSS